MCCRGTCSRNGDMRQRSQVMDGESLGIQKGSKLSIAYASLYRYCARGLVHLHGFQVRKGNLVFCAVCNGVKRMSRSQDPDFFAALDYLPDFFYGCGFVQVLCAV